MEKFDEAYIRANFGLIWPRHVESLTRFLIECRRHFDGDLDMFLVLAVIGDRSFAASRASAELTYPELLDVNRKPTEPEALNVFSISQFSGIPRETVRRKVNQLIEKGWVERDEQGFVRATRKAAIDLHPLTEISFEYLARMARVFSSAS